MISVIRRREFLKSSAAIVGLGNLGSLGQYASAADPETKKKLSLDSESARLAKLIHDNPREKLVGLMLREVRKGVTYEQFLGGLYTYAIRHAAFHKILSHHPMYQLSMSVSREERLLPLFWHLDSIKLGPPSLQILRPIDGPFPAPEKAGSIFDDALNAGDADTARRALIALARSIGSQAAYYRNMRWLATRPKYRSTLGHRTIWGGNAYRSQALFDWPAGTEIDLHRHRMVLDPSDSSRANMALADRESHRLPQDWTTRRSDKGAVLHLLSIIRGGNPAGACQWVGGELLDGKLSAQTVWDAVFLGTSELLFARTQNSVARGVHTMNTLNSLSFAYREFKEQESQFYALLQAIDWSTYNRQLMTQRNELLGVKITELPDVEPPKSAADAVAEIFDLIPPRRVYHEFRDHSRQDLAAQLTFAYARKFADHSLFLNTARRLICLKATVDGHGVKFPVMLFENYTHTSPAWRPHLLAASTRFLQGTQIEDSPAMQQAREELKG